MKIPHSYPSTLRRAGRYLAAALETREEPVLTPYKFFRLIEKMYSEQEGKKLYLRHELAAGDDYTRLRANLKSAGLLGVDRDYGGRLIRILSVSDAPAEEIVCLADPLCYISHLSAMQRWGLTNRRSEALICTRPDRLTATARLMEIMKSDDKKLPPPRLQLKYLHHPKRVRRRAIHIYDTKSSGASIRARGGFDRLATIGQTFLDMMQKPELCGGMNHILDVYEEYAEIHLEDIVAAVDTANSKLIKSRAGYILEERMGLRHQRFDVWKALGQRGGSRKLDPSKDFASTFSETWMISLNV